MRSANCWRGSRYGTGRMGKQGLRARSFEPGRTRAARDSRDAGAGGEAGSRRCGRSAICLEGRRDVPGRLRRGLWMNCGARRVKARTGSANCRNGRSPRTGIKSLKVRFNSVFGYFIEVTKSNLGDVPARYTRKQTTVGGERFITPELKEMEAQNPRRRRTRAAARVSALPNTCATRRCEELAALQATAAAIATLDVLCALAETARLFGYCRPTSRRILRLVIRGWPPSRARSKSGGGEVRP